MLLAGPPRASVWWWCRRPEEPCLRHAAGGYTSSGAAAAQRRERALGSPPNKQLRDLEHLLYISSKLTARPAWSRNVTQGMARFWETAHTSCATRDCKSVSPLVRALHALHMPSPMPCIHTQRASAAPRASWLVYVIAPLAFDS